MWTPTEAGGRRVTRALTNRQPLLTLVHDDGFFRPLLSATGASPKPLTPPMEFRAQGGRLL